MKEKFSFLKDPRALLEISKHKWIESEKRGEEIGFATAAVDWAKKYGQDWKRAYFKEATDSDLFIEKRRYRRFPLEIGLVIKRNETCLSAAPKDINLEAISCKVGQRLPQDGSIEIILKAPAKTSFRKENYLKCKAKILRIAPFPENLTGSEYNVVLMPGEECRELLRGIVSKEY